MPNTALAYFNMNWKDYIPELSVLLKDYKTKRSKAKSAWNKYQSKSAKYNFLNTIVKPKEHSSGIEGRKEDDDLEIAIKDLFNSIGIHSVRPTNKNDFDVKSKFSELKLGIEVKNGNLPAENDLFQAHKYAMRINRELEPLIIWNNSSTNQEFDSQRIKDAELSKYGLLTTKELLKGYIKLKSGNISFNQFIKQLKQSGLIKYSAKELGKSKNSEGLR